MGRRGDAFSWSHSHVSEGERGVVEDDPFALGRRGIGHSLGELLLLDHSPQGLDRACILLCLLDREGVRERERAGIPRGLDNEGRSFLSLPSLSSPPSLLLSSRSQLGKYITQTCHIPQSLGCLQREGRSTNQIEPTDCARSYWVDTFACMTARGNVSWVVVERDKAKHGYGLGQDGHVHGLQISEQWDSHL